MSASQAERRRFKSVHPLISAGKFRGDEKTENSLRPYRTLQ
jgi:hypothetical protein